MAHTDRTTFDTAVSGMTAGILDFDGIAAGTIIASGETVGSVTFTYDFGGVQMDVSDVFDTTSAPNFLGTDDGNLFLSGDDFTLSFDPLNALGMFFLSTDRIGVNLLDGDIALELNAVSAGLDTGVIQASLADGSNIFFLGIVDAMPPFTSISVTSTCCGFFFFNVDDIVTGTVSAAVPGALGLLSAGLAGLMALRRRCQRGGGH